MHGTRHHLFVAQLRLARITDNHHVRDMIVLHHAYADMVMSLGPIRAKYGFHSSHTCSSCHGILAPRLTAEALCLIPAGELVQSMLDL